MLKLLLKNNLSAKIKLELKAASDNKFRVEPSNICLSAFESIQVKVSLMPRELSKYVEKQKQMTLKEHLMIKSDFFLQKVPITICLIRQEVNLDSSSLL